MDNIVRCRIDKRPRKHPINCDHLIHVCHEDKTSDLPKTTQNRTLRPWNIHIWVTGWSVPTGLTVESRATFHSRNISAARAAVTSSSKTVLAHTLGEGQFAMRWDLIRTFLATSALWSVWLSPWLKLDLFYRCIVIFTVWWCFLSWTLITCLAKIQTINGSSSSVLSIVASSSQLKLPQASRQMPPDPGTIMIPAYHYVVKE